MSSGAGRDRPITTARESNSNPKVDFLAPKSALSVAAGVRPPQREFNDHSVQGTFLVQCMNLHLLPKLSSWPTFRHCHHAQDGQRLLEVCHREDSSIIHNGLCPSRWNTWQSGIHPRTDSPYSSDIPSNWSFPSTHKCHSRLHISQSIFDSL